MSEQIPILVVKQPTVAKTLGSSRGAAEAVIEKIDVSKLRQSITDLNRQISEFFGDIKDIGAFKLKEIEVSVEISAEGGIHLIGTMQAGARGAISLTFAAPEAGKKN